MTHSTKIISTVRQRMIEDMTLRKLSPKTLSWENCQSSTENNNLDRLVPESNLPYPALP